MIVIHQVLSLLYLGLLVFQMVSGMVQRLDHNLSGLAIVLYGCLVHSLVLTYFIGTGRSIKDAVESKRLNKSFYDRSRAWYRSLAYPLTGVCVCVLMLVAILGAATHSYMPLPGTWDWIHPVSAWLVVFLNFKTYGLQKREIVRNSVLLEEANSFIENPDRQIIDAESETPPSPSFIETPIGFWVGRLLIYIGVGTWVPFIGLRYLVGHPYEDLSPWPFLMAYLFITSVGLILTRVTYRLAK